MLKMCVKKIALEVAKGGFCSLESDLMWDFLDAVQRSNVIQRIDGWRQSSMETENLENQLQL